MAASHREELEGLATRTYNHILGLCGEKKGGEDWQQMLAQSQSPHQKAYFKKKNSRILFFSSPPPILYVLKWVRGSRAYGEFPITRYGSPTYNDLALEFYLCILASCSKLWFSHPPLKCLFIRKINLHCFSSRVYFQLWKAAGPLHHAELAP